MELCPGTWVPVCAGPSGGEGRVLRSATRSVLSGQVQCQGPFDPLLPHVDPGLVTASLSPVSTTCRTAQTCAGDPRRSRELRVRPPALRSPTFASREQNKESEGLTGGSGLGTRDGVTELDWKPGPSPAGCTLSEHPNSLKFQFPCVPKSEKGVIPAPPPPSPEPCPEVGSSGRWRCFALARHRRLRLNGWVLGRQAPLEALSMAGGQGEGTARSRHRTSVYLPRGVLPFPSTAARSMTQGTWLFV